MRIVYLDCSPMMRELLDETEFAGDVTVYDGDPTGAELKRLLDGTAIALNGHTYMDAAAIAAAPQLRSIVFLGTGASSYIDVNAAERQGVRVRTIKGYGDRTVAEHAFALLMTAARDVARMDRNLRDGRWQVSEGLELQGRTLGLIGLGGIGSEMARMASAFGLRVIAWNRSGVPAGVPAEAASLDTVLASSDAISLHLGLNEKTHGLLDRAKLASMKPGAILVNTARAALVDEVALIEALRSGRLAHAALDVFEVEPLPAGHVLTTLPNVTLTAHAGWKSRAASRRLLQRAFELARADSTALAAGTTLAP